MHQTLRNTIWLTLVTGGVAGVLLTLIFSTDAMAVLVAGGVALLLVAWGIGSAWLFGLKRLVIKHMKRPIDDVTFVCKDVGSSRVVDYVNTLEYLCQEQSGERLGANVNSLLSNLKLTNIAVEKVDWNTIEGVDGNLISVPTNGVYFFHRDGEPFVARLLFNGRIDMFGQEDAWSTGSGFASLEVCATSLEQANVIIRWLSSQTSAQSIYRGQMLRIASPQDGTSGQTIRMTAPPKAPRESIVLPDSLVDLLQRLVRSRQKHRRQLERFGHKAGLGLLLHGPPGTGKTLITKYLIGCCPEHTVIVPSDMSVETLRESFRMAKYLQPSILVIEDVDLLAPRRESNLHVDRLQELMNELDGLGGGSDTIVILSTNRPEVLEPALASRPGRISQTVEFPLPDQPLRQQLLKLFLGDASSGGALIAEWAKRTEKASPAFLEELCKRAILLAAERQMSGSGSENSSDTLDVQFDDVDAAIHELVVMGGDLTTKVLGFAKM